MCTIRIVEDYGVIYLGSAVFKIARLLFVAMFSVHFFACLFFRVKEVSATAMDDVTDFYTSKNVAQNVSHINYQNSFLAVIFDHQMLILHHVHFDLPQDLAQQYVRTPLYLPFCSIEWLSFYVNFQRDYI